ncbi:hypothetical protein EB40_01642 [Enterococcus faecium]|nr:hypothetical protein EB40_01642 [Enterococcus faecium]
MNIPFVVETVLHDGLLKYKFKNSKIRSITTKPGKSKRYRAFLRSFQTN